MTPTEAREFTKTAFGPSTARSAINKLADQIESLTKERDALTSDNISLHRQLERWQGIAVERAEECDAALEQNTQLDARCAKLEAAGKLALEALEVATTPLATDRQEVLEAITALRQAGVQ